MTLQVTAAPWSAKGIIAALREVNHIALDRSSVKECNNKTCINLLDYYLCCLAQWILWLNKAWTISGSIFQAPAFTPLSEWAGYPSPWGCPRWIPILLGRRMCKAHPKTYRAAFLKCLALWAPKVCHLFSLFKRLSSLKSTVERKPLFL